MAWTDPEPADPSGRARRLRALALAGLPLLILFTLGGATLGVVVQLGPGPGAVPVLGDTTRPTTPILSLRRDLEPFVDQVADRRMQAALAAFVAEQPPDTCLVVRGPGIDFSHRGEDPQVPASAQKLLTGVAALVVLGPDSRYRTPVVAAAAPVEGRVGDLYLVGAGDPLLATASYAARFPNQPQTFTDLATLADALVAAGVTRVEGAVLADESRYDTLRHHPAWPSRFVRQKQTGPLSAVAANDGFETWPTDDGRPGTPAPDPAALGAQVLRALLVERGVAVAGGAGTGVAPPGAVELAAIESAPVRDVVAQMLRESDNATAELVLKELGVRGRGEGSAAAGAAVVTEVLAATGFDVDGVRVSDGSGLSPDNIATCELLVDLIEAGETASAVVQGLAVSGTSGTLARRWLGTDLVGRIAAKTGTLNQVTALVGTTIPDDAVDEVFRFAVVVNVAEPAVIQLDTVQAQQRLAALLADPPGGPDLSGLRP